MQLIARVLNKSYGQDPNSIQLAKSEMLKKKLIEFTKISKIQQLKNTTFTHIDPQRYPLDLKTKRGYSTNAGPQKPNKRQAKTPQHKMFWTKEEDLTLLNLVQQYGENAWHRICKCMPNKTEVRCFKRWQEIKDR